LPALIYLIDEQKQPVLPKFVETGEGALKLKALKDELKKRYMVSFFTTPEDLAKRVAQDLPALLQGTGITVAAATIAPPLEDVKTLMQRFTARPRKYAGKELIVDVEIGDKLEALDLEDCNAFGLTRGDAISRSVKCDVWRFGTLIASRDQADWLE